jgi:hypothetical protein
MCLVGPLEIPGGHGIREHEKRRAGSPRLGQPIEQQLVFVIEHQA